MRMQLETGYITQKEYDAIIAEDKKIQILLKYTNSIYEGEYSPIDNLIMKIELYMDLLGTLERDLAEYEAFEHHSIPIVLTIAHKGFETRQEIDETRKQLEEMFSDAKLLGLLEVGD